MKSLKQTQWILILGMMILVLMPAYAEPSKVPPATVMETGANVNSAIRSLSTTIYTAEQPVRVTIKTSLDAEASIYAIEETPPVGWAVSDIDNGGNYMASYNKLRWGPFFDNASRTFAYTATPPANASGTQVFSGVISVDGSSTAIVGTSIIGSEPGRGKHGRKK